MAFKRLANGSSDKIERTEEKMDPLTTMYRNIEVQVGQIANAINVRQPGELPSRTKVNLGEHVNAIMLRSGRHLEEPNLAKRSETKDKEIAKEEVEGKGKDHIAIDVEYPTSIVTNDSIPFPGKLTKDNKDREFEKNLQNFK